MKKLILGVALLLVSTGAFAQMDWGIKAGVNLADITKLDDSKMKPSFYAGAFIEFKLAHFLSIQPEVVYSRQGSFAKEGDYKEWLRLNYLNVPVMIKLYMLDGFSLDLGPQFGILLNSKLKVKNDPTEGDYTENFKGTKNFDVSFAMGLSYKITSKIDVSARYNLGLTKVVDDFKGKNSVFQFGMGYRF